jgi:hypothetical protein
MPVLQPPINFELKARDWTDREGEKVLKIVIHATAGTDSRTWLSGNPNGTSIHVLIMKNGLSYKMLHESRGANHVGYSRMVIGDKVYSRFNQTNCNQVTLGIELENLNNGRDPYPEAQLRAAAWWVQEWLQEHNLSRADVIMHRDIDTQGKSDAAGISVMDILRFLDAEPTTTGIFPSAPIIGAVRGSPELAAKYLAKRGTHVSYTSRDHLLIARYYWAFASSVGVDPLLAFAQMCHETGNLTSWWSLRERRNPCGLGVTGETSRSRTKPPVGPGVDWQYDSASLLWKKGFGFRDWQIAAKAHLGHLLVYAVAPGVQTPNQRAMVAFDPRAVAMPLSYKGVAKTWNDLEGRWAVPGENYADRISAIATDILHG